MVTMFRKSYLRFSAAITFFSLSIISNQVSAVDFERFGLGVGLSITRDFSSNKDRVESASIIDGVVRVEEEKESITRVLLEAHYFFEPKWDFCGLLDKELWGFGPFVAIQPGESETIDAFAFGAMIGFLKDKSASNSFNLGLGFVVDPNTKVLGDGLWKNAPTTEQTIRYKTESETGLLFLVSFSF